MTLSIDITAHRGAFTLELALRTDAGITVLYGPSGSGKSTVLDCMDGSLKPSRGRIDVGGETLFDSTSRACLAPPKRRTPRVYQEGRLFPHLSVRRNLLYGHTPGMGPSLDEVTRALEIHDLLERPPRELSGGQRQRVAVGRALLAAPRALLLDEPLASLDQALRRRILPHLRGWQERFAVPFVYVTHAPEEALLLGDTMVQLDGGRVVAEGAAHTLLAHAAGAPAPGLSEDDTVFSVSVEEHHDPEGITVCRLGEARLKSIRLPAAPGTNLYLALSSRDVLLCTTPPIGLSARNCLGVQVEDIHEQNGKLRVAMRLNGAPTDAPQLYASVTREAAREMDLATGRDLFAIFKSSALRSI